MDVNLFGVYTTAFLYFEKAFVEVANKKDDTFRADDIFIIDVLAYSIQLCSYILTIFTKWE
jgi:hypothetical protein